MKKKYLAAIAMTVVGLSASGAAFAGKGLGIEQSNHNFSANRGTVVWNTAGAFESWGHIGCGELGTPATAKGDAALEAIVGPIGKDADSAAKRVAIDDYAAKYGTKIDCVANGGAWLQKTSGGDHVNADGWARGEVCRVCHSPHEHGKTFYQNGLLWNKAINDAYYAEGAFMMYEPRSVTQFEYNDAGRAVTGVAKKCLGCHDGSVGVDTRYGLGGLNMANDWGRGNARTRIPGQQFSGGASTDLRGVHPISIVYPCADEANPLEHRCGVAGGYNELTTEVGSTTSTAGGAPGVVSSGTIADILDGGMVQCSSCHDVHDSYGVAVPGSRLVRVAQNMGRQEGDRASGLCLTCHDK